jgi:hypothetical protein
MLENAQMDYDDLQGSQINRSFFDDYNRIRIVNSFLFNFGKLQDKIGAKLFRQVLYDMKEIDSFSLSMLDVLHLLEKYEIITDSLQWERLREIRNILAHEYPYDIDERIENITLALEGFIELTRIYANLKTYARPITQL